MSCQIVIVNTIIIRFVVLIANVFKLTNMIAINL